MSIRRAQPLLLPAPARHTATVIWVHGLGDTGHGWAPVVENWRRRQRLDEVKFVLPHAPSIPITCNMGSVMPGWYDIAAIDGTAESLSRSEDEAGILRSQEYFHGLIQNEVDAGIPGDRIVLGGFSQGGAISIFSGLTAKVKLAGIVGLSSYLLLSTKFDKLVPKPEFNKETPILMAHGDCDVVVKWELGDKSYRQLKDMGYNVKMTTYKGMGHNACLEELDEVEAFLRERLPALDKDGEKPES
ncbi:Phospholipase/carboxylesterase/thioesterase [Diplogelasinospora grovesii]|uniref:Acyl-protein thioesterase 1 n=1 Tax=Diplogelasinospora grovesii TaxID=303347 RepID=A0AAN6NA17_9PEZI|nr:Phospholipase/carboxylesterase/thioesterase [Diplogelasinospora grovesii]